jgi:hypothetical protein
VRGQLAENYVFEVRPLRDHAARDAALGRAVTEQYDLDLALMFCTGHLAPESHPECRE